jgi:hypothetical protein
MRTACGKAPCPELFSGTFLHDRSVMNGPEKLV